MERPHESWRGQGGGRGLHESWRHNHEWGFTLLQHGCFTHLFPARHTLWLTFVVVLLTLLPTLSIVFVDWQQGYLDNASRPVPRAEYWIGANALFQAVSTRTAGINSMDITYLSIATQFLLAVCMYIAASPTIVFMRFSGREQNELFLRKGESGPTEGDTTEGNERDNKKPRPPRWSRPPVAPVKAGKRDADPVDSFLGSSATTTSSTPNLAWSRLDSSVESGDLVQPDSGYWSPGAPSPTVDNTTDKKLTNGTNEEGVMDKHGSCRPHDRGDVVERGGPPHGTKENGSSSEKNCGGGSSSSGSAENKVPLLASDPTPSGGSNTTQPEDNRDAGVVDNCSQQHDHADDGVDGGVVLEPATSSTSLEGQDNILGGNGIVPRRVPSDPYATGDLPVDITGDPEGVPEATETTFLRRPVSPNSVRAQAARFLVQDTAFLIVFFFVILFLEQDPPETPEPVPGPPPPG